MLEYKIEGKRTGDCTQFYLTGTFTRRSALGKFKRIPDFVRINVISYTTSSQKTSFLLNSKYPDNFKTWRPYSVRLNEKFKTTLCYKLAP